MQNSKLLKYYCDNRPGGKYLLNKLFDKLSRILLYNII